MSAAICGYKGNIKIPDVAPLIRASLALSLGHDFGLQLRGSYVRYLYAISRVTANGYTCLRVRSTIVPSLKQVLGPTFLADGLELEARRLVIGGFDARITGVRWSQF
jgi:hypothetical protein